MTNIPRINAPRILTIKTLRGKVLNNNGDSVILYLRKAPNTDPHHYGTLVVNLIANTGLSIGALIGGKSLMAAIING